MNALPARHGLELFVGPSKHSAGGRIRFGRYGTGEIAMRVFNEHSEAELTPTVCLAEYKAPHPGKYGVWLKEWSENEGIGEALEKSRIITISDRTFTIKFADRDLVVRHGTLTPGAELAFQQYERGLQ